MPIAKDSITYLLGANKEQLVEKESVNNKIGGFLKKYKINFDIGKKIENFTTFEKPIKVSDVENLYNHVEAIFKDYSSIDVTKIDIMSDFGYVNTKNDFELFKDDTVEANSTIEFITRDQSVKGYIKIGSLDGNIFDNEEKMKEQGVKGAKGLAIAGIVGYIIPMVGVGVLFDQGRKRYNALKENSKYQIVLTTNTELTGQREKEFKSLTDKLSKIEL